MTFKYLKICEITADPDVQVRDGLDPTRVQEYAEAMKLRAKFPRPVVFFDGLTYWLSSGFHRRAAASTLGEFAEIECDVRDGGKRDAILFALGDNKHGLHLTQAERKRAIERMLFDPEWSKLSDNEIARHIGVSPTTVGKYRSSLSNLDSEEITQSTETALGQTVLGDRPRTYTTKHGTRAKMRTASIGKKKNAAAIEPSDTPTASASQWPFPSSLIDPAANLGVPLLPDADLNPEAVASEEHGHADDVEPEEVPCSSEGECTGNDYDALIEAGDKTALRDVLISQDREIARLKTEVRTLKDFLTGIRSALSDAFTRKRQYTTLREAVYRILNPKPERHRKSEARSRECENKDLKTNGGSQEPCGMQV
ncbi:helix-turn-helix domain containing protein [Burkholderia pseudomallei]|uniref:helix-turn-helix domain containing protein n=1 Tax=Burkholderia pseudomallei TaxID=28450 RepID=UPI00050DA78F|nr:helix-turn-helix domain containing protein [Burkholderia pseudomallei]KGC58709.1 helix-turn-helix domain protein [Burkholderia pseudomallei]